MATKGQSKKKKLQEAALKLQDTANALARTYREAQAKEDAEAKAVLLAAVEKGRVETEAAAKVVAEEQARGGWFRSLCRWFSSEN